MRLKHITFTGIDARTDIKALQEIQHQYPIAEFGVLTSYHWYENGNRYLDPQIINTLRDAGLHLALHVCGQAAHDATIGRWDLIDKLTWSNLDLFDRVQLNIANRTDNPTTLSKRARIVGQEVIIQHHDRNNMTIYEATFKKFLYKKDRYNRTFTVLLDASGGQGIDTPIEVAPPFSATKVGYAGGINPDNVADKLAYLLEHTVVGDFWIDMESGVRTGDWFDIDKVRRVLATCNEVIKGSPIEDI